MLGTNHFVVILRVKYGWNLLPALKIKVLRTYFPLEFQDWGFPFDLRGKETGSTETPVPLENLGPLVLSIAACRAELGVRCLWRGTAQDGSTILMLRPQVQSSKFVRQMQRDGQFKQLRAKKKKKKGILKSKISLTRENKIKDYHIESLVYKSRNLNPEGKITCI